MESVHQWFLFRIWNDKHIGADAFAVWIPDLADTRALGKKSGGCWTLAIRSNHVRLQCRGAVGGSSAIQYVLTCIKRHMRVRLSTLLKRSIPSLQWDQYRTKVCAGLETKNDS